MYLTFHVRISPDLLGQILTGFMVENAAIFIIRLNLINFAKYRVSVIISKFVIYLFSVKTMEDALPGHLFLTMNFDEPSGPDLSLKIIR